MLSFFAFFGPFPTLEGIAKKIQAPDAEKKCLDDQPGGRLCIALAGQQQKGSPSIVDHVKILRHP